MYGYRARYLLRRDSRLIMRFDFSLSTAAGLLLTPVIISAGQVLFKLTSDRIGETNPAGLMKVVFDPLLLTAFVIYGFGTILWVYTLRAVPLTVAYPFMALTFCIVPLLALVFLGEPVSLKYALGSAMIMTGLLVING